MLRQALVDDDLLESHGESSRRPTGIMVGEAWNGTVWMGHVAGAMQ